MTDLAERIAALPPEKRKLLMRQLEQQKRGKEPEVEPILPHSSEVNVFPLSFSQKRLWFLEQLEPGNVAYNLSIAIRLKGNLNLAVLERSINEIVRRHEALRTTFDVLDEQPVQVIHAPEPLHLQVQDLRILFGILTRTRGAKTDFR